MTAQKYVLHLCHDYSIPFLDVARQYASLFKDTEYKVITAYLVGEKDQQVVDYTDSDEVLFLSNRSGELKGLKRKQIQQIKQLCSQYDFQFAIGHRYQAIYILRHIKDLPVIGVNHSFGKLKRFTRRLFLNMHKKNLYLLGVSNAIRDEMRASLPNFSREHILTLYNRINVDDVLKKQLSRSDARKHLGLSCDQYVFANVGRLHPDKDQKTLINAFAKAAPKLPDTQLVILGKGRLEQDLKDQVKQLQLEDRVLFLGLVPDAVNYFRAFDGFVLSSDFEPFGMVLLESIIADVPVIATNVGGAKEVIKTRQWLFEIGNVKQLEQLMVALYNQDEKQCKDINTENKQWMMQHFTDEAVKESFWSLPFIKNIS